MHVCYFRVLSFEDKQLSWIFPISVYPRRDWNTEGKVLNFTQSYIYKMRSLEADIWVSSVAWWSERAVRDISSSMSQYHNITHIFHGKYSYIFFSFIFAYHQIPTILPVLFFIYIYMQWTFIFSFIFLLLEYANIGDYIYEKIAYTVAF